ncbi:MAG: hypothetical protein GF331_13865 [Chitinivibrionales bacterium]|nr:hypothetical protein [Chitinivibrionales bacterium]
MAKPAIACLLALLITCAPGITVIRGPQPFAEPATGLQFAAEICGLPKREIALYPQKELGLSVHYEDDDMIKATFYVYSAGDDSVGDGAGSPAASSYFLRTIEEIREMHRRGRYGKARIGEHTRVPIRLGMQRLDALCAFCELSTGTLDLGSVVLVTGYRDQLFKVRFTYPKELEGPALDKWECVLRAFAKGGE